MTKPELYDTLSDLGPQELANWSDVVNRLATCDKWCVKLDSLMMCLCLRPAGDFLICLLPMAERGLFRLEEL